MFKWFELSSRWVPLRKIYYINLKNKTSRDNRNLTAQGNPWFSKTISQIYILSQLLLHFLFTCVISLQVRTGDYSSQLLLTCKIFEDCTQFVVEDTTFQAFTLLEYAQKLCRQFLPLQ